MVALRVTVTGTKELQAALSRMNPEENRRIKSAVLEAIAVPVQRNAANVQLVRSGDQKSPPLPDRLTNRHGGRGLAGSIAINRVPLPRAIEAVSYTHLTLPTILLV